MLTDARLADIRARILAARLNSLSLHEGICMYQVCLCGRFISGWLPFMEAVERLCAEHAARVEPGEWFVCVPDGLELWCVGSDTPAGWHAVSMHPTAAHALIAMLDRLDAERGEVAATDMECVIIGKCDDLRALVAELEAALLAEMDALKSHPILAKKHTGMRVSLTGAIRSRNKSCLTELHKHLNEMARRYYDGDIAVVDEFLQLYCLDETRPKEGDE